jgi:hypothetical protein
MAAHKRTIKADRLDLYAVPRCELRRVSIGPDLVSGRLWRETRCGEVISGPWRVDGSAFDVEWVIYLRILHRLMVSGSDRHARLWHHSTVSFCKRRRVGGPPLLLRPFRLR